MMRASEELPLPALIGNESAADASTIHPSDETLSSIWLPVVMPAAAAPRIPLFVAYGVGRQELLVKFRAKAFSAGNGLG